MPQGLDVNRPFIIGGGPAGSALAILLARAGLNPLLLEKETAPHHKVCGEFYSHEAVLNLYRLGLDVKKLGAQPVAKFRLSRGHRTVETDLPFTGWGLSRRVLDQALLETAASAGAEIRRGSTVSGLYRHGKEWRISLSPSEALRAGHVFLATGKHNLRGWRRGKNSDYIGFKIHLQLSPPQSEKLKNHIELALFDDGYAGLQPVEDNTANLCFLVKNLTFRQCGKKRRELLGWLQEVSPLLARRLSGARALWPEPLTVYGLPYGFIHKPEPAPDLYRLGDQAAVIHSLAGSGVAMALHSAFLAADHYIAGHGTDDYHRAAARAFRRPAGHSQIIARLAASPAMCHFGLKLAGRLPGLLNYAIRSTRVG